MPPKKPAEPSKKTEMKKKEKIVEVVLYSKRKSIIYISAVSV